jgi:ATP-binding cassette, subfamily B, bacterial
LRVLTRSAWWESLAGAWRTSSRLTVALAVVTLLAGLLPTASSLASGTIVQALPDVVAEGMDSAPGRRMIAALAALAMSYVALQLMGPLQLQVFGEGLGRRYMGWMHRRIMRAALQPATIRHLEEPRLHDRIRQSLGEGNVGARVTGIAGVPPGLARLAGERLRGLAALAVVAHFNPWLALLLALVWLHHVHRLRSLHNQLIAVHLVRTPGMRYGQYLGALPVSADVAKEVRVFGLGPWLGEKFERTWLGEMAVLWARRRGATRSVVLATAPVLAAQVCALGLVGRAAALGEIGLGALMIYATAVRQSESFGSVTRSGLEVQYGTAGAETAGRARAQRDARSGASPTRIPPGGRDASARDSVRGSLFYVSRTERAGLP